MQLIGCSNGLGIWLNGSSYLLKKWSAVRMAQAAVWAVRVTCSKAIVSCLNSSRYPCKKNCFLLEQLRLSVWKKLSAVRTARAIYSKKIGNLSKARSSYLIEEKFAGFPSQNNFLTSHLSRMICYSPGILEWSQCELCLQTYSAPALSVSSSIQPFHFERLGYPFHICALAVHSYTVHCL